MRFSLRRDGKANEMILLFSIASLVAIASATPSITFPLNSQVPPVARVDKPFAFTLSPSTFTSDTSITYSLKSGPVWLSLDEGTRTLSGTPLRDAEDVVAVEIEATDSTGSTIMSSKLVVSSSPAPEVVIPLSQQIDKFADYSAPNSLLFYPSTGFKFSFNLETFRTSGKAGLNKYAVTLDNAPLPSWINFDDATMTFWGEAPDSRSLISPPEQFGIQLIASEILGFGEVSIPFFFVVQNHKLVWEDSIVDIKAEAGSLINFKELAEKLELDEKAVAISDLEYITSDAPEWLKFDAATFALFGIVPNDVSSLNVTITAVDKFDDVASVMISIDILSGIFADEDIPPLNATIGQPFSFNIGSAFSDLARTDISVSIVPETPWLSYDERTFIMSGHVPDPATASSITVVLRANANRRLSERATDTKSFTINVVPPLTDGSGATSTLDVSSATPSLTSVITPADIAKPVESSKGISKGQIAAAVVVPNVILILAALLLFRCWRRRQQRQLIEKAGFVPTKKTISRPQLLDPPALLTPSSSESVIHPALRSHRPGFHDDTSIYTRPERGRRSISKPKLRRSISNMTSRFLNYPLRRSISDNYITYGLPSLPSTYTQGTSSKAGTAQTKEKKKRKSEWCYQPYRTFSDQSELSGSIQITPEASYMHNYGQYRISKPPKTRNYLGSIDGSLGRRYSGLSQGRAISDLSNYGTDTQIIHRQSGGDKDTLGHGGPGGKSMDSEKTWQTVHTSHQKSLGRGRPNSTMSAVTENTDILSEYYQLPRLPPAAFITTSSSDRNSSGNYLDHRNTIRLVSQSSNYLLEKLPSSNTMQSSSSSVHRPVTRRGGSSPFFGGSARTNSRAARRRSAKVNEGYLFSDEMDTPSIAERDETNASLERSTLSELNMDSSSMASRSNSRAYARRDVLGRSYGGQTPDMASKTRKSRVYVPAYKSTEEESTQQPQAFYNGLKHRPSW